MRTLLRGAVAALTLAPVALVPPALHAQTPDVVTTGPLPIRLTLDTGTFAFETGRTLLELHLAVEARSLAFTAAPGGGFEALLPLTFSLAPPSDAAIAAAPAPVWADSATVRFALADTAGMGDGRSFLHVVRAPVPPGDYELRVGVPGSGGMLADGSTAAGSRQSLELRRDIRVPAYDDASRVALSEITLASSIAPSNDTTNPFYRSGVLVRPNATQVFGEGLSRLFYYAEVYRPGRAVAAGDTSYTLYAYVASGDRPQAIGNLERRTARRVREVDVLAGSFDVSTLPSGTYTLRVAVLSSGSAAVAEQSRRFYVYNPDVPGAAGSIADVDYETSLYATLDEAEVGRSISHLDALVAERERRRVRALPDLDARRRYLWEFWQQRDPNPQTAINEAREDYYRRLAYANERYGSPQQEGWRTDRGRVLLRFGLPSSIEPHLYERDSKPYEVWYFNNVPGEGQATFVFGDLRGGGVFEQISSTIAGERSVPDWQRVLSSR